MVRVGLVGIGFMGWIHWLAYRRVPGVAVTAIVSRSPRKRQGDWRGIQGNFGPPGEQVDLRGTAVYADLDSALADAGIDVVDLCLPPRMHEAAARAALAAGKHVLCEKPLALDLDGCQRMLQAARDSGRQLLVAHVLPFFPEYAAAGQRLADGSLGRPLGGSFRRVISEPSWVPGYFDPQAVGGPLLDLHVHDAHWIAHVYGLPRAVVSTGRMRGDVVEYCQTLWRFDDPQRVVHSECGVIGQPGRPFMHGFEMQFERGLLEFEFAALASGPQLSPLKLFDGDGNVERIDVSGGEDPITAFAAELAEMRDAIAGGGGSQLLSAHLARDAVALCAAQAQSVAGGGEVELRL